MLHTVKINDRSKAGKALLEIARRLSETTKAITFVDDDEVKKITLDELIEVVGEQPLLGQLKEYRKKGITDLRIIAKELGFTREDKEDLALLVMMSEGETGEYISEEDVMKKLRAVK